MAVLSGNVDISADENIVFNVLVLNIIEDCGVNSGTTAGNIASHFNIRAVCRVNATAAAVNILSYG